MDSCNPKEVSKYHKYTMQTNRKFFRTSQTQTLDKILVLFEDVGTLLKFGNPKIDGDRLKIGLKSLTAHVYANKSRTKCRTSLLFVSMDSCDPKEVCKYHKYTMETNKKFFRTSQRQTLDQILVPFEDVGTLPKFGSPKIDGDRL